jgi:hypothetical protein
MIGFPSYSDYTTDKTQVFTFLDGYFESWKTTEYTYKETTYQDFKWLLKLQKKWPTFYYYIRVIQIASPFIFLFSVDLGVLAAFVLLNAYFSLG